jgi:hypothetical protein
MFSSAFGVSALELLLSGNLISIKPAMMWKMN